jgi:hypothetical protein
MEQTQEFLSQEVIALSFGLGADSKCTEKGWSWWRGRDGGRWKVIKAFLKK